MLRILDCVLETIDTTADTGLIFMDFLEKKSPPSDRFLLFETPDHCNEASRILLDRLNWCSKESRNTHLRQAAERSSKGRSTVH